MVVEIAAAYRLRGLGFEHRCGRGFFGHIRARPEAHSATCKIANGFISRE
jgi:hypothetical protein